MKHVFLSLAFTLAIVMLNAQSAIFLNSGSKLEVVKLKPTMKNTVQYTTLSGESGVLNKDEVDFMIRKKDVLIPTEKYYVAGPLSMKANEVIPNTSCTQGMLDAISNANTNPPMIGTGVVSLLAWPVGLVTAVVVASSPPNEQNMNIPVSDFSSNPEYLNCYTEAAHKKKKRSTWMGWGLGTTWGIAIASLVITLSSM